MNKKGYTVKDLLPVAMLIVISAVAIGIGAQVLGSVNDDYVTGAAGCNSTSKANCGYAYNATDAGLTGSTELASWIPTIALVIAAAIVIGILVYSFAMRN